jgi:heme/copper-type cytochrome/quinol oxidase subunit 3
MLNIDFKLGTIILLCSETTNIMVHDYGIKLKKNHAINMLLATFMLETIFIEHACVGVCVYFYSSTHHSTKLSIIQSMKL